MLDSNQRPSAPKADALPDCANLRNRWHTLVTRQCPPRQGLCCESKFLIVVVIVCNYSFEPCLYSRRSSTDSPLAFGCPSIPEHPHQKYTTRFIRYVPDLTGVVYFWWRCGDSNPSPHFLVQVSSNSNLRRLQRPLSSSSGLHVRLTS